MNGYIIFFRNKRFEVQADSLYEAKQKGIEHFKVKHKDEHLVVPVLAEKLGKPVQMDLF